MTYTLTRVERKKQVERILKGRRLTIREIAREMGIKKTPYLRNILRELVNAGQIKSVAIRTNRSLPTIIFFLD